MCKIGKREKRKNNGWDGISERDKDRKREVREQRQEEKTDEEKERKRGCKDGKGQKKYLYVMAENENTK